MRPYAEFLRNLRDLATAGGMDPVNTIGRALRAPCRAITLIVCHIAAGLRAQVRGICCRMREILLAWRATRCSELGTLDAVAAAAAGNSY